MIIDEAFNSGKLIEFLQALIRDAGKKVFLILDSLSVHHSKPVKAWVQEYQDKIELFYLPCYSPELNPKERALYKSSSAYQGQAESGNGRTHASIGKITGARPSILPRCTRKVRSVTHE